MPKTEDVRTQALNYAIRMNGGAARLVSEAKQIETYLREGK